MSQLEAGTAAEAKEKEQETTNGEVVMSLGGVAAEARGKEQEATIRDVVMTQWEAGRLAESQRKEQEATMGEVFMIQQLAAAEARRWEKARGRGRSNKAIGKTCQVRPLGSEGPSRRGCCR